MLAVMAVLFQNIETHSEHVPDQDLIVAQDVALGSKRLRCTTRCDLKRNKKWGYQETLVNAFPALNHNKTTARPLLDRRILASETINR